MILSDEVRAFLGLVRHQSVTAAAQNLFITQAALSIKIKKMEEGLGVQLFTRSRSGVQLTPEGENFLRYALQIEEMSLDWSQTQKNDKEQGLSGVLKVAAFSTVGRSLVIPAIQKMLNFDHQIEFYFYIKEIKEIHLMLEKLQVDFGLLDNPYQKNDYTSVFIGYENYVLIKSAKIKNIPNIYLNHDPDDLMSFRYYESIGEPKKQLDRMYLDEIYSVIDGVALGWGLSVVPEHLVSDRKDIKIVNPSKKLKSPVYLCFQQRHFRSHLFQETLKALEKIDL